MLPTEFNQICLTLDVDWARDEMLQFVVARIRDAGLQATFFATHDSPYLRGLADEALEIGLHPNFNQSGGDFRSPIEQLKALYPAAKGGRSHGLFVSSAILLLYREFGLEYESNIFLPGHEGLHPVTRFQGFTSIPFFWSDDKHLELQQPFEPAAMGLDVPGLKVLNFHPIHVYMNTYSDAHYQSYKQHYQDIERLEAFRDWQRPGVGTLFQAVVDHLRGTSTPAMHQIHQQYAAQGEHVQRTPHT